MFSFVVDDLNLWIYSLKTRSFEANTAWIPRREKSEVIQWPRTTLSIRQKNQSFFFVHNISFILQ